MDIVQKGGGGGLTGIQKFWNSFVFFLSLTFVWTLNGWEGGGGRRDPPQDLRHLRLNIGFIFEFWAYAKVNSPLSKMGQYKMRGGGSRPLTKVLTSRITTVGLFRIKYSQNNMFHKKMCDSRPILTIHSSIRSLQETKKWVFCYGRNGQTDTNTDGYRRK